MKNNPSKSPSPVKTVFRSGGHTASVPVRGLGRGGRSPEGRFNEREGGGGIRVPQPVLALVPVQRWR